MAVTIRRGIAAVVASQLLWLSSCSEDDPEPVIPEPSASTSSTPTTTPTTPTPSVDPLAIPAAAREETKAGAEALVRHYYEMFNHLWATGDSAPVRRLYGEGCDLCEIPIAVVELSQSKGNTYEGSYEVLDAQVLLQGKVAGILGAVALVDTRQTEVVERDAQGRLINRFPSARRQSLKYNVAFQGGAWVIINAEASR